MSFTVEIEGLEELQAEWGRTCDDLEQDLNNDAVTAAKAGVTEVQESHPYTDRTYQLTETAHEEIESFGVAAMVWPKDYAAAVDAKPGFNFTDKAVARADASLEYAAEKSVDKACDRMGR